MAVVAAIVAAGCMGPEAPQDVGPGWPEPDLGDGDPVAGAPGYRLILIEGNYTAEPAGGEPSAGVCGFPTPPDVNRSAGTIAFHSTPENLERVGPETGPRTSFPLDSHNLTALALLLGWDSSACGVAVTRAWPAYGPLPASLAIEPLQGGTWSLRIEQDGSASLDKTLAIAAGAEPVVWDGGGSGEDGSSWNATYKFQALGLFPAAGLSYPDF